MWDAIACTLVLAAGPTTSAVPAPVPDAIDGYYRDYDLVTAFSTPGERTRIAAGGAPASDARLARIAALMKRLEEQVDEVDPGMVMSSGRRWQETAARADLLRVASWRMGHPGRVHARRRGQRDPRRQVRLAGRRRPRSVRR